MGKSLEITKGIQKIVEQVSEFMPRHQCRGYIESQSGKTFLLTKEEFDSLFREKQFDDGPYKDNFGNGNGEPYNPNRQAFGKLKDGRIVYCELSEVIQEKVQSYLENIAQNQNT
jgi:hypothetical protein